MKDHDQNRHNIGMPSRLIRRKSADVHKKMPPAIYDSTDLKKLPSLIGEHKKIQEMAPEGKKLSFQEQDDDAIPQIIEEDHDWMGDSMIDSGFEMKSSSVTKKR